MILEASMRKSIFLSLLGVLLSGFLSCDGNKPLKTNPSEPVVGGNCRYEEYAGTITVKKVELSNSGKKNNSSTNSESVLIEYEFAGDKNAAAPPEVALIEGIDEVKPEKIKEKDVKVGKRFRASASYQTSGTCNPGPYVAGIDKWEP